MKNIVKSYLNSCVPRFQMPSVVSASHLIGESDAVGPAATPSARGPPHRARSRPRGRSARPAQQAGVSITKGDGIKRRWDQNTIMR